MPKDEPRRHEILNLYRDLFVEKERDHGGTGALLAHRAYSREEASADTPAGVAFIDVVILPPGVSIGLHTHGDDAETYIILRGAGLMHRDGGEFRVETGDVVHNRPYGTHGLVNDGEEELHLLVFEIAPAA
ncbi:cupin domain-containing protein [Streptomyces griseus]|uniref:cupin domain-containing protein n=1 Tax=Streptomyces TaxID=1883 RepID=UPI0029C1EB27|nr:cupin domain-containing protein [Streptomyces sp. ID01-9D]MDX5573760.1 cupin domain-containing protein [Streptomyces sp. ID01-9D]WSV23727.1 cupin domain-containing protein [Streptomyces fimicarius]WTC87367.1 cupin domain-containing protein [Streptomyces griseus]WTD70010.1 cupin domain-containing protein [Streptomyces griseus]